MEQTMTDPVRSSARWGTLTMLTVFLLTGCAQGEQSGPGAGVASSASTPESGPDPALAGVQPLSEAPVQELREHAVRRATSVTETQGGTWTAEGSEEPVDVYALLQETLPQSCTSADQSGEEISGHQFDVVLSSTLQQESAEETLRRFEDALTSAGYTPAEGNGVGPAESVVANGQSSEQGRLTLRRSEEHLRLQLRTACSSHPSVQNAATA